MAIDNRYTFRDALALYTKNLILYDTDQETIQSGDDGNLITVHTGLGDMSNITSLLTGIYAALGTPKGRRGAEPIFQKVALSGTWDVVSGNTQLLGTGGAANTELVADDIIFASGRVLIVSAGTSANIITLYKAPDFNATGITLYRLYPLANRLEDMVSDLVAQLPTVGSVEFIPTGYYGLPTVSAYKKKANGQTVSDAASPFNGKRLPNLNGATLTGISISALDNTAKTVTISTNDIWALAVGDALSFTGASVSDAVVKSINYTTGIITVGDFTLWSSGVFKLTTGTLTGATALSSIGRKRFLRGNSAGVYGGGINTIQGFKIANGDRASDPGSNAPFRYFVGTDTLNSSDGEIDTLLTGDGTNNTPRTSTDNTPDYFDGEWYIKIK